MYVEVSSGLDMAIAILMFLHSFILSFIHSFIQSLIVCVCSSVWRSEDSLLESVLSLPSGIELKLPGSGARPLPTSPAADHGQL